MKTLLKICYCTRQGVHRLLAQLFSFSHQFSSSCKYIYMWIAEGEVNKLVLHNIWAYESPTAAKLNETCTACKIYLVFLEHLTEELQVGVRSLTWFPVFFSLNVGFVFQLVFPCKENKITLLEPYTKLHVTSDIKVGWVFLEIFYFALIVANSSLVCAAGMDLWKAILTNHITYYRF